MSQINVDAIRHTSASSDAITLASNGKCAVTGSTITADTGKFTNLPNRNLIINGAMNVAQRATTSTATGYKTVDRIQNDFGGTDEAITQSQHDLTSSDTGPWGKGFRHSFHIQNGNQTSGAGATDFVNIHYTLEAQDIVSSGWDYTSSSSKATVSFWAKSSVGQTFYGYFRTWDGTAYNYNFPITLSADTWTKITTTIPGNSNLQIDNDNGLGLSLIIVPFLGTDHTASGVSTNSWITYSGSATLPDMTSTWWTTNDATFEITGLQLEVGDYATDFEHKKYTTEWKDCCRYYYKPAARSDGNAYLYGCSYHNSWGFIIIDFPNQMRAIPTLTVTDESTTSGYNYATYTTKERLQLYMDDIDPWVEGATIDAEL